MDLPAYLIPSPDGVPWLTLLVLSPLVGILLVGLSAALRLDDRVVRLGATAWTGVPLAIAWWSGRALTPRPAPGARGRCNW